jgi:hypothetical protein
MKLVVVRVTQPTILLAYWMTPKSGRDSYNNKPENNSYSRCKSCNSKQSSLEKMKDEYNFSNAEQGKSCIPV